MNSENGFYANDHRPSRYMVDSDLKQTVAVIAQATEANERQIREVARNAAESFKEVSQLIEKSNLSTNNRIEALSLSTNTKLENLGATFQASQKPNYMLWVAAIAVFFTLISAGWKITDLQTQVTMAPIATQALQNKINTDQSLAMIEVLRAELAKLRSDVDTNSARDEVSEKDRAKLNEHSLIVDTHLAKLETDNQVIGAKLAEVETQFKGEDHKTGIQFAEQQRTNNLILQIAQKKPIIEYPSGPYYIPEVANPAPENH